MSCTLLLSAGAHAEGDPQPASTDAAAELPAPGEQANENAGQLGGLQAEAKSEWWIPMPRKLGLEWASTDERFSVHAWLRGQFRYSEPFDSDPLRVSDFADEPGSDFEIRRARLKIEAQLGSPDVTLYFEHELSGEHPLLDLRVDLSWQDWFHARIGQYKVLYNRERVDSSGKQTFVERSISTYAFTLDRQRGVSVASEWGEGTRANQWLMLGVFEGDGRAPGPSGDGLMYVARWQWAFLGRDLPFSQSDLKFRDAPAATLAFGASTTEGPYTRFSSSGGGQLDGFTAGGNERYNLRQFLQEFAWHYAGYEFQQEYHVKLIDDAELDNTSSLRGGYAQFGKLWNAPFVRWSLPTGLAFRYAQVDWDDTPADRVQREHTLVGNLFIDGHNNKLSAELSRIAVDENDTGSGDDIRFRLQWDVSF
jgi:phosphate-selective porin OprO and OprP